MKNLTRCTETRVSFPYDDILKLIQKANPDLEIPDNARIHMRNNTWPMRDAFVAIWTEKCETREVS